MVSTPCLEIRHLDLVFGTHPRLAFPLLDQGQSRDEIQSQTRQIVGVHDASFRVFPGEVFAIMGLSGSGKSSLLRCLNGMNGRSRSKGIARGEVIFRSPLSKTTGGKATADSVNLTKCSEKQLRELRRHHISMVFQQFGLLPWLTALENVAYPLKIQGVPKKEREIRALEKLHLVGLTTWSHHYPSELSGGMQQRVGLARAFVTQANLLLMDEPFSALDPIHRKTLQDEVIALKEKLNKTMILVTHDFSEASRIANRVALVDAGKILQIGTPSELRDHPVHEKVEAFTH